MTQARTRLSGSVNVGVNSYYLTGLVPHSNCFCFQLQSFTHRSTHWLLVAACGCMCTCEICVAFVRDHLYSQTQSVTSICSAIIEPLSWFVKQVQWLKYLQKQQRGNEKTCMKLLFQHVHTHEQRVLMQQLSPTAARGSFLFYMRANKPCDVFPRTGLCCFFVFFLQS